MGDEEFRRRVADGGRLRAEGCRLTRLPEFKKFYRPVVCALRRTP